VSEPLTAGSRVIDVPGVPRFEVAPHHCFACGTLNEHGLGIVLHVEPRRAWSDITLGRHAQGWDGIAHGGIICTILDEVMAWSLAGEDNWGVTARMQVDFRRPVAIGTPIRAEGWIVTARRRVIDTAGHLLDAVEGTVLASATGLYVAADEARKRQLRERYGFRAPEPAT